MIRSLHFRLATQEDLVGIVEMLADDPLGSLRESKRPYLSDAYAEAFRRIRQDKQQELTVAEQDGKLVATFQLSFIQYLTYQGGIRAQLEAVRVGRRYRGQGIGRAIVQYALERAKKRRAHLLQLTTDKKRPEAIKFYESLGFRATHEGMKLPIE